MNQDEDLCVYALLQATEHWITSKNKDYMLNLFKLIKVRTEQVIEMALCMDGRILQFIEIKEKEKEKEREKEKEKERERDKEDKEEKEEERFVRFCKIAVENTPAALQWIPYPIQKQLGDDCLITSLARDGKCLQFLDPSLQSEEICKVAVRSSPHTAIAFVLKKTPAILKELKLVEEEVGGRGPSMFGENDDW